MNKLGKEHVPCTVDDAPFTFRGTAPVAEIVLMRPTVYHNFIIVLVATVLGRDQDLRGMIIE